MTTALGVASHLQVLAGDRHGMHGSRQVSQVTGYSSLVDGRGRR